MEIRIGIQHVSREITVESDAATDQIEEAVTAALLSGELLTLDDVKGGRLIVPSGVVGYVHIAASEKSRVGFGIG